MMNHAGQTGGTDPFRCPNLYGPPDVGKTKTLTAAREAVTWGAIQGTYTR
jgi:hypothetical protein